MGAEPALVQESLTLCEAAVTSTIPHQLAITRLSLTNFRCYENQRINVDSRPVVLTGPNGAGKTNLLEALSFLVPGRGMRRAKLSEIGRRRPGDNVGSVNWAVAAKLRVDDNELDIGTGCEFSEAANGRDKRIIKIDGSEIKSQAELGRYTSAQWLTPQMDRLFLEGASGRRRFVDQLIYGLDPEHAGPVAAYDHSVRSRNKLLREGNTDPHWLDSIEESLARNGVAIAVRRLDAVQRVQQLCHSSNGAFPGAEIAMTGQVEDWLSDTPALAAEDQLREALRASRTSDGVSGSTSIGPHRSDFAVYHGETGMAAEVCSTGEQKALLIGIILATARLQTEERGYTPLLLLDEIAAHLDEHRRASLFELILDLGAQAWITGTEDEIFSPLGEAAQHLSVADGTIT